MMFCGIAYKAIYGDLAAKEEVRNFTELLEKGFSVGLLKVSYSLYYRLLTGKLVALHNKQ